MNEFEMLLKQIKELCLKNSCNSCPYREICVKTLDGALSPEYWEV